MTDNEKPNTGKPWPVIIMLAMLTTVIGLGLVLSPKTEEEKMWWVSLLGTTNNGTILNPPFQLAVDDLLHKGEGWGALSNTTFKLVLINQGICAQDCQEMLLSTRQMHVRLNRDYKDVERGFLALDYHIEDAEAIVAALPDYDVIQLGNSELLERLATSNIAPLSDGPLLIMINPVDTAMMAYTSEQSGSELLEDIEHLLDLAR